MAERKLERMSVEAFLAWEAEEELRYELVDGVAVAMTGGTAAHDRVRGNVFAGFHNQLQSGPCVPYLDVKVACPSGNVRYPDVAIDCGGTKPTAQVLADPRVVIEVLSPSTRATDFLVKLKDYESVPGIEVYAILWQDQPRAMIYRRDGARLLLVDEIKDREGEILFPTLELALPMALLYRGMETAV